MQAGLSFRKDFPIPQLYIDRIIIPEVSKVHSTLPRPQPPWRPLEAEIQKPIKKYVMIVVIRHFFATDTHEVVIRPSIVLGLHGGCMRLQSRNYA